MLNSLVRRIHLYFIPHFYWDDETQLRKTRILVNTNLISAAFAFFYLFNTVAFSMKLIFWAMLICTFLFLSIPFLLRWGVKRSIAANMTTTIMLLATIFVTLTSGALYSFDLPWLAFCPICAVLLQSKRNGWFWLFAAIAATLLIAYLNVKVVLPKDLPDEYRFLMQLNSMVGLVIILFVVTMVFENAYQFSLMTLREKNKIIEEEKKRSDDLLLNILPAEVMEELKKTGKTTAHNYDLVTVLFADIVDFTTIIEELPPEELVAGIDAYFGMFDRIIETYGIEKIKTVGDAYICASGVPVANMTNPVTILNVALEMMTSVEKLKAKRIENGEFFFDIRIGIHSGPLVAGVVGVKKFAYDIWGDTVNTAARMQQCSEPGKINISSTTHDLVKHRFACSKRGRIEVKHKGSLDMFFVEKKK